MEDSMTAIKVARILRAIRNHPDSTNKQVSEAVGLPMRTVQRITDVLTSEGLLRMEGQKPRRFSISDT